MGLNPIGEDGIRALITAIKKNTCLKYLGLEVINPRLLAKMSVSSVGLIFKLRIFSILFIYGIAESQLMIQSHRSIYQSINQLKNQSSNQPVNQWLTQSISQSISHSFSQSINRPDY